MSRQGRLRVLGMVPYPPDCAPSQRFRLEQWMPHLAREGVEVVLRPFQDTALFETMALPGHVPRKALGMLAASWRRVADLADSATFDVVFLHREALSFGPAMLEHLLARRRPFVFDFDDAIWMPSSNPTNPIAQWLKFQSKTASLCRLSSAVLAGNEYLATWARRHQQRTFVVPTTIDTETAYQAEKRHRDPGARPVVGWSGSSSTLKYLEAIRPALAELARQRPYRLLVIGNPPAPSWPELDVEFRPWSSATEVANLLEMDVGLMPQPDEEWAEGKCGLKALQYMALGIPPVASGNGVLREIVRPGENGVLVHEPAGWADAIGQLLGDVALRARLGANAKQTVVERYSARVQAGRVATILRETSGGWRGP
jgi:glycosyltransferase involved in cell wall biosynthesis